MTLLLDTPAGENGLVVQRCGLWGYNAIGVVSGDEACAVVQEGAAKARPRGRQF